jgi:hypothetical protein
MQMAASAKPEVLTYQRGNDVSEKIPKAKTMFLTMSKPAELRLTVSNVDRHPKMQMAASAKPEVLTYQRRSEVYEKFQRLKLCFRPCPNKLSCV